MADVDAVTAIPLSADASRASKLLSCLDICGQLIPLDVQKACIVTRNGALFCASNLDLRQPGKNWPRGFEETASPRACIPGDVNMEMDELQTFLKTEIRSSAIILSEDVVFTAGDYDMRQNITRLWEAIEPGNSLYFLVFKNTFLTKTLYVYRILRSLSPNVRVYAGIASEEGRMQYLVSTRYALQRRFITEVSPDMRFLSKLAHRIISIMGVYPWIESQHVITLEK